MVFLNEWFKPHQTGKVISTPESSNPTTAAGFLQQSLGQDQPGRRPLNTAQKSLGATGAPTSAPGQWFSASSPDSAMLVMAEPSSTKNVFFSRLGELITCVIHQTAPMPLHWGLESMLLRGFHALASYVLRDGDQTSDLKRAEAHFNAALRLGCMARASRSLNMSWFFANWSARGWFFIIGLCSTLWLKSCRRWTSEEYYDSPSFKIQLIGESIKSKLRNEHSSSPRARFGQAVLSAHRGDWQTALNSFREAPGISWDLGSIGNQHEPTLTLIVAKSEKKKRQDTS